MTHKLIIELGEGSRVVLDQTPADNELQLQELLKREPTLLPLDELGVSGQVIVVGRESSLDSGKVDLVLLGHGGDLILVEFKTGPQNPDFRECLAQLLDYGSDLWGMTLEEFEARVVQRYFKSEKCPKGSVSPGASLDDVMASHSKGAADDAIDWRERLRQQLRDGSFHYVAVAQRFTQPVLRTLRYLNATMKAARFSAVELVRFTDTNAQHNAYEARFVAGAQAGRGPTSTQKANLAGVDDLLEQVTDDLYRHSLQDFFDQLAEIDGLTIYWGTTGCSLRVLQPDRPLSIGWIFPPGPPRWMGLRDTTLGWAQDGLSGSTLAVLQQYVSTLATLGGSKPASNTVHGLTFPPSVFVQSHAELLEAVRHVTTQLTSPCVGTAKAPSWSHNSGSRPC